MTGEVLVHGLATYKWVIRVASYASAKVIAGLGCCYHAVMAEGGGAGRTWVAVISRKRRAWY